MHLKELEAYQQITIQAHDNPDADAIASGYALYTYFKRQGKDVTFIYSGRYLIQRTNLRMMIEKLDIPIQYREMSARHIRGLLITVDCQYGAGNVYPFTADQVAVIDHHQKEIYTANLVCWEIASNLGSCSTLIWKMLIEEQFPVNEDINLGTALYYGLYRDTNQFSEICYPLDMDMRELVTYDKNIIHLLRNSNLSLKELEIAGIALIRYIYKEEFRYAIIQAQPCDPNLLGLISDFLIQVDEIETSVVFNEIEDGYKFSVRSCVKEVKASELAQFLAQDVGSGGGHREKAGGFISKRRFEELYPLIHSEVYFGTKMNEYFESFDIMDMSQCDLDTSDMGRYYRKEITIGYVRAQKLYPSGTQGLIRTLDGDIELKITKDMYIILESNAKVRIATGPEFDASYRKLSASCDMELEYMPRLKNMATGESKSLVHNMAACTYRGHMQVFARRLERGIKLFSPKNPDSYMLGRPGDYLVAKCDNPHEIFIVEKQRFPVIFEKVEQFMENLA